MSIDIGSWSDFAVEFSSKFTKNAKFEKYGAVTSMKGPRRPRACRIRRKLREGMKMCDSRLMARRMAVAAPSI